MAEAVGFEPTVRCRTLVFKTSAFDHSATLPIYGRSTRIRTLDLCIPNAAHYQTVLYSVIWHRLRDSNPLTISSPGFGDQCATPTAPNRHKKSP